MAFAYGDRLSGANNRWTTYWIYQYGQGNIKIHANRNNIRYDRTSQEAYDNMLTLYTILSDTQTGTYLSDANNYCLDLLAGTPGTIRDFIIKSKIAPVSGGQGGQSGIGGSVPCGSDVHGSTAICGQGGVDINRLKSKNCLMTNIAGLMGVIEVISGYNPFFHTQEYLDLQGYDEYFLNTKYYDIRNPFGTYSRTDRYNASNYSLADKVWTPYTYANYKKDYYDNVGFLGTPEEMNNCRYGILGLLMPYSASCYSYGRKYNDNGDPLTDRITDGDEINYIEQILYDICGVSSDDYAWYDIGTLNYMYFLTFGLSNGQLLETLTQYVDTNNITRSAINMNARFFNNNFVEHFNHWNGQYTKREFGHIICRDNELEIYNRNNNRYYYYNPSSAIRYGGYIASEGVNPAWTQRIIDLADYQYLPWWATGTRDKPEAAAVQLIHSLDTWNFGYWTSEKIQQAREAARYWYDRFGGPKENEGIVFQGKTKYNYTVMNI